MYDLQLRKGGVIFSQEWDSEKFNFVEKQVDPKDFPFCFKETVCFSSGVTLKDVFLFIKNGLEFFSIVTSCPFLDELVDEALSKPSVTQEDIVALELSRIVTLYKSDLNIYSDFHGIGDDEIYSLEFIPINELISCPLILNENITIVNEETEEVHLKCKMKFNMIDILSSIIDELSFMGPPDLKELTFKEIKRRADEANEDNTILWEDLKENFENKPKIPCKICGKDATARCFDKPSDICLDCFKNIKEN